MRRIPRTNCASCSCSKCCQVKATAKVETSDSPQSDTTPEPPALPTFPDECDVLMATLAKKMRQEIEPSVSVKANHSAMSSLFGDVYITSAQQQKQKSYQDVCQREVSEYKKEPPINSTENLLNW